MFYFFFFLFPFLFSLTAVGSGGVRARPKPAEFPLLRKVPLTSAVSEILKRISENSWAGVRYVYRSLRGYVKVWKRPWSTECEIVIGVKEKRLD